MWSSLSAKALLALQRMDLSSYPGHFFFTPTEEEQHTEASFGHFFSFCVVYLSAAYTEAQLLTFHHLERPILQLL